jgi:4-azaleucine resistance transporter AzlC
MSSAHDASTAGATGVRTTFKQGFRDILPVMVATAPFGLVFGALAAKEGFSLVEAMLMSGTVYGGASQFVVLQMWTDPLPFWTILMSALAVNLRHVLYSASIGRKMAHWPAAERYAGLAFLTDPTFAFAESQGGARLSPAYYFGLGLPLYASWMIVTILGAILGNFVRRPEAIGLDFVVTAYFLVIVLGYRKRPNALPVIGASAAAALAAYLTLGPPWHFAAGALAGMATAALLGGRERSAA